MKNGHGIVVVDLKNILFIEKNGNKSIIHTTVDRFESTENLMSIEKKG